MKKKAFTLIELLVVISIIALLMAILLPALSKVKAMARVTICGTRIKQNILGAIMAAEDNNGNLPKGGLNYKGQPRDWNFDDAISFRAEEYLNLCNYIVGSGSVDIHRVMAPAELEDAANRVINSDARLNFVCTEYQKDSWSAEGINTIPVGMTEVSMPYIHSWGASGHHVARIGYCYLAGFDTESWDWLSVPNDSEKYWRSPMKTSDRGDLAMITDRVRFLPNGTAAPDSKPSLIAPHAQSGKTTLTIEQGTSPWSAASEFTKIRSNVGTLDGAVRTDRLPDLKPHHVTMSDNRVWSHVGGGDYYYW